MSAIKYKKILHLIDTTGCGGAERVLLYIICNLASDYRSFVILPNKGWLYEKIINLPNIEVCIIDGSGRLNFAYIYNLIKFIKKNKIDIIHSHLLGSSLYASISGIICRRPVICTFHGFIDADLKDPLLKLKFSIIKFGSKRIVSVSYHLTRYIEDIFGRKIEKCTTIYNGIPTNGSNKNTGNILYVKQQFGFSDNDIIIGSVGNVKNAKGYGHLIKAAKLINDKNSKCKFIIAGKAEGQLFNKLNNLCRKLSLTNTVKFIGYQEDVGQIYKMMDLFILPSITEGFSLSTVEAMSRGIPVIVTKSGGPEEIVKNNFSGLIVNVSDEHALAEAQRKLFTTNAHQTISDHFSINSMMNAYKKLYQEALLLP